MLISDSYSNKTSSSLPIIISFSSQLKTQKIRRIREFLKHHPNCQKYVTKGPNFVADGVNEFRLYYVDSSLYADEITLKRLNVEKEEIMFGTTSEDSLETSIRSKEKSSVREKTVIPIYRAINSTKKMDKATICRQDSCSDLVYIPSSVLYEPAVTKKVSKSFQIGPDLRFNVVYVNTDLPCSSFKINTNDAFVQTESLICNSLTSKIFQEYTTDSTTKYRIKQRQPIFSEKPEKKIFTFKDFYTKMEDKALCKYTDESEFNRESTKTSLKFSIKKSPPFVANYILKVINTRTSSKEVLTSEIYEESIVNYLKYEDFKTHTNTRKINAMEHKKELKCSDLMKYNHKRQRKMQKDPLQIELKKNKHHAHKRKGEKNKNTKNNLVKIRKYQNMEEKPRRIKVEFLFKRRDMDFFLKRSHYAILKKYHKQIKEREEKHLKKHGKRHSNDMKKVGEKKNHFSYFNTDKKDYKEKKVIVNNCQKVSCFNKKQIEDSGTKTTISGFLQSYKPWHWQDNSKLSVCIDEECFSDFFEEENKLKDDPQDDCKISKIKKYFAF